MILISSAFIIIPLSSSNCHVARIIIGLLTFSKPAASWGALASRMQICSGKEMTSISCEQIIMSWAKRVNNRLSHFDSPFSSVERNNASFCEIINHQWCGRKQRGNVEICWRKRKSRVISVLSRDVWSVWWMMLQYKVESRWPSIRLSAINNSRAWLKPHPASKSNAALQCRESTHSYTEGW